MIGVQMGDEKIGLCKIDVELFQCKLYRIQTFFPIESGIDNQIPV